MDDNGKARVVKPRRSAQTAGVGAQVRLFLARPEAGALLALSAIAIFLSLATEQFLTRYVLLVPTTWDNDVLIITRQPGSEVLLDDVAIPDSEFSEVAGSGWEVTRHPVADGVHTLESAGDTDGLGVIVVGWDLYDSYAYAGGMGMEVINPEVE